MRNKSFAVFILTHKRANNIKTEKSLRRNGYTGKIYYVIDDTDPQIDEYKKNFGRDVIVFSKKEVKEYTDTYDNFNRWGVILYARQVCFRLAKDLGLEYFLEADDDYSSWGYRFYTEGILKEIPILQLDNVFDSYIDCLRNSDIDCIAMAQGGDFIGGYRKGVTRKIMNTFFCRADRPIEFYGTLNEDVNCYTLNGSRGAKYFTYDGTMIGQEETQKSEGGITDAYKDLGTYVKSFYSIMAMPSAIKIGTIRSIRTDINCKGNERYHHSIDWNSCVPKVISPKYRNNENFKKKFKFGV